MYATLRTCYDAAFNLRPGTVFFQSDVSGIFSNATGRLRVYLQPLPFPGYVALNYHCVLTYIVVGI
ncbi:hypothetical protein M413DRAFT_447823 [Hebeloma cylindrosporum]|uniref:Uncharacterized protein n=1 Tax=Hebeloma cylindrosporum TaxID=76867 RepID=A0A0C3BNS2_HEBCY|nr:hypothetical protein M413DRAFT_447823 [Hebeloma cylindrosporum h7]